MYVHFSQPRMGQKLRFEALTTGELQILVMSDLNRSAEYQNTHSKQWSSPRHKQFLPTCMLTNAPHQQRLHSPQQLFIKIYF